jgi:hypothetical protein
MMQKQDTYAMMLELFAEGKSDEEVATATGWELEAVLTIRQELEYAYLVH